MSFDVNGTTWTPQTAATHAQTQLTAINALRASRGESLLVASPANAIWLELLAAGSLQQHYDDLLYSASQSFNVSTCSDSQVLNLLPITGTQLIPATYSTVDISVTASAAGPAIVPAGTLAVFGDINFAINATTTVPTGTTVALPATADAPGPYLALPGNISAFKTTVPNVQVVTNANASTQGRNVETITQVRNRLISTGSAIGWSLDGTIAAIRSLQGIITAQIYFNPDTVNDMVLTGGTIVKPRYCRIVIQGTDVTGQLATTYASRQTAPTEGALSEKWVTLSNQSIPIFYDTAAEQPIYIRVYYDPGSPMYSGFSDLIKSDVVALGDNFIIGQDITSQVISEGLINFPYAIITGVTVSADNITFSREAAVDAVAVGKLSLANVAVIAGP